ncbi:hypothetical protein JY651_04825 [Pyxidicoccus parkwayensis]|uniref:Uncharacterized protein n=1 Tax=Pyxidicoccus parkwayensis TaxID=2813578 RepID=A0ABX7P211_9BACT|nr:hypothetical protein [Pyxidicoccus parkwaysis]QSQ24295.1 hypothetical protein JY651_04825 [Pyxidicoccus parkwaysis]
MKLLGRDIPARELISRIEERLRARGLPTSEPLEVPPEGVEPRVEPLTFNLHALEENADATRALPLHTHRGGAGQLVLVAKWAFRKSCQVFINEALGRQRVFNGHVRDSYAQLSAEVIRLRREVEELRARAGVKPPPREERPVPAVTATEVKVLAESQPRTEQAHPHHGASTAKTRTPSEVREPVATAKNASRAKDTHAPKSASEARAHQPATPRSTPETRARPAEPKSAPETRARPTATGAQVLPPPRNSRAGEGQSPRAQAGSPRARPETPSKTTQPSGQRPRKSGDKRRGRRK